MKIISKRQAMTLYRQHPGSRLFRFSTGKYKWSGSICHYAGREVEDIRGVLAVFAERRQDRNGPYVILRSVTLNKSFTLIRNNNELSLRIRCHTGESPLPALGAKEYDHTLFWSSAGARRRPPAFSC